MGYANIGGQKHFRLTALEPLGKGLWLWQCECGKKTPQYPGKVVNGIVKSCGCYNLERVTTHGKTGTRTFNIWQKAKARCVDPNHQAYKNYGGRGIEFRVNDFSEFYAAMGDAPPGMYLDRIDNDGHYEIGNLRWATPIEQHNNTRRTRYLTMNGTTKSVMEWARELGLKKTTIYSRLKAGYPVEHVLSNGTYRGHGKQPAIS